MLQLPVPQLTQLQSLNLKSIKIQALGGEAVTPSSDKKKKDSALTGPSSSSAASSSGSAAAADTVLQQLRELRLHQCDFPALLACQLLGGTSLTNVQWHSVQLHKDNQAEPQPNEQVLSMLGQRLQLLPQLSTLELGGDLKAADVSPISTLKGLKQLGVCMTQPTDAGAAAVAAAPAGLTALHLKIEAKLMFGPSRVGLDTEIEADLSRLIQLRSFRGAGDPRAARH
jgi:hypothetical protein